MKYDYEESMKEALKVRKGISKELNREILMQDEGEKHVTYFPVRKFAACAAIVAIFLVGSMGVSYAAGVKPIKIVIDHFSQRDESVINKVEVDGTIPDTSEHQLTLNEYYLDALGYGEMTFSLMKKDGTRQLNATCPMKAYYYTANDTKIEFEGYGVNPIYSKAPERKYIDGVRLEFSGSDFKGGDIVIEIGKEIFSFTDIEVTQPHYLEWKTKKGSVYLSGTGMLADGETEVCNYIDNLIGTEKDTEKMAMVCYKDGKQVSLQLLECSGSHCSIGEDAVVIQFSPYTEFQKHIKKHVEEGWEWNEEIEEEMKYNFSTYTFALDEISKLQIGDITLDVEDAEYH